MIKKSLKYLPKDELIEIIVSDKGSDRKLGVDEDKEIWSKACSSVRKMPEKIYPERKGKVLPFLQNNPAKGKKQASLQAKREHKKIECLRD